METHPICISNFFLFCDILKVCLKFILQLDGNMANVFILFLWYRSYLMKNGTSCDYWLQKRMWRFTSMTWRLKRYRCSRLSEFLSTEKLKWENILIKKQQSQWVWQDCQWWFFSTCVLIQNEMYVFTGINLGIENLESQ